MVRRPRLTIPVVLVSYAVLAVVAVVWDVFRSGPSGLLPPPDAADEAVSVALALAFTAAVVGASRLLDRYAQWARRLTQDIAAMIGPLTSAEIAVYAGASGLAEEMFFRGAMQPTLGLWVTSLIFGLCHGYFDRRFAPWVAMATVTGLGLGVLAEQTGSLLAPVLAHFSINFFEFHALNRVSGRESG